jgi:hypothetical protein
VLLGIKRDTCELCDDILHPFPIVPVILRVDLGGLVVSVLATGPKVRGIDPDRGRWIFKGDKNPEHHFLRRGSKAVGRTQ